MGEDDALLAAIHADPDDDAARAVYGDRLLERGDPRGELVALQLADARGTANAKDRRRIDALLRAHWPEWGAPLYGAIVLARSRFERGFLARVAVGLSGVKAARVEMMVGDPIWATVRHVESAMLLPHHGELIRHPIMRAVRSLGLFADNVPATCAAPAPWALDALALHALPAQLAHALADLGAHAGCATARSLVLTIPTGGVVATLATVLGSTFAARVDRLALELPQYAGDADAAVADAIAALASDAPFRVLAISIGYITVTGVRGRDGRRAELGVHRDGSNEHARAYANRFVAACGARFTCAIDG